MIDNFKTDLVLRVAAIPHDEILRAMGYQKPTSANLERLQNVLDGPEFGLNDGGFDFKYSSEGFLRAMCVVTGMDMALADQRICRIKKYLEEERDAFKPYLWVDTGFKRTSQPIFALAVCEHQRYLDFSKGFWRLSIERQLGRAQCRVREHVYETGGELGIWGHIKQYWFYYKKNAAYLLALNGEVIGKHEGPVPNQVIGTRELSVISLAAREAQR
ncbi:hypothetical protein [Marinobacter sp. SS5-14b]|jgi:hypothetical protein|uniref:hypothetical protein n=1 Tax=Marinobacter sp. SS5-14b TaxID=3050456 RepID=UPI0026DF91E9|nr:hypothetical protein [Marinobacter sp. SS5-14b]|tara:strand:+ start:3908 stop:4555 length:648 start_codon:yes stop_codon:yes gene_type:complete